MAAQKKNPAPVAADAGKGSKKGRQNHTYDTTASAEMQALSEIPAVKDWEAAERCSL